MKDVLITFETAKLAKEKGFIHMKANCYGDNMCYQLPEGELINALKGNTVSEYILAPTQSLLQKWLREVYDLHILMNVGMHDGEKQTFYCNVFSFGVNLYKGHFRSETSVYTYEQALEKGLQEALKLIKPLHK